MAETAPTLAIAIPAYNRAERLDEVLVSILAQSRAPDEVVICEDHSPQRTAIAAAVQARRGDFATRGIPLIYHENLENLGYDGNLRQLFSVASADHVAVLGNDDRLDTTFVEHVVTLITDCRRLHGEAPLFISRAYRKIDRDGVVTGTTWHRTATNYCPPGTLDAGTVFHWCAFISGLVFARRQVLAWSTDAYDGGLYYQFHLALSAAAEGWCAYLAEPVVEGRHGVPPDFGASSAERATHRPGGYSVAARTRMWQSVLAMASQRSTLAVAQVRRVLDGRYAFPVVEMIARDGRGELRRLWQEFRALGLFRRPLALTLIVIAFVAGRKTDLAFGLMRRLCGRT